MRLALAVGLMLLVAGAARSDVRPREDLDAARLKLALRKLRVTGSALYVAAHPDDENTALLAYLSMERGVRTGYLSMTRGDGGQNLIGAEAGEQLGVIRTQELLAARRVDGAEQFFTRALDFGYSKTADETMRFWGRDSMLADVVWVIRRFRPDVIVTRFPVDGRGGHGHHTASAQLAEEAFAAAADPTRFPEQLSRVQPWQAKRLVWNVFRFGPAGRDTAALQPLQVDLGHYSPLLGQAYSELAAESRSMHKSQGFGAAERRGSIPNDLEHRLGTPARDDLFEGVAMGWTRVAGGVAVDRHLAAAEKAFDPEHPERIVPTLLQAWAALRGLEDEPVVAAKRAELLDVIRSCAGLWLEAIAARPTVSPGGSLRVATSALQRSPLAITLERVEWPGGSQWLASSAPAGANPGAGGSAGAGAAPPGPRALPDNRPVQDTALVAIPAGSAYTQPYWLREPAEAGRFRVADSALIGLAENPAPLAVRFVLRIAGTELAFDRPVVYRWTDPVEGERYRPLEIVPPVSLKLDQGAYLFPGAERRDVLVTVERTGTALAGVLRAEVPAGWSVEPRELALRLEGARAETTMRVRVAPPPLAGRGASGTDARIAFGFEVASARHGDRVVRIDHPHIPIQTVMLPARARLVQVDLQRVGTRIGYVMGSGDQVADGLRQMGYDVTLLSDDELAEGVLQAYDAIVVGVRAYNTRPRLRALRDRLRGYVVRGGTLVVQYQTADAEVREAVGLERMSLSRDRVSQEDAAVRILDPREDVLRRPNAIADGDFSGWVQERGLYFADRWDSTAYRPVLSLNDDGETAKLGSVLVAEIGNGMYVYTGLSFFRQLPAGVPGAYRLFANLVGARQPARRKR